MKGKALTMRGVQMKRPSLYELVEDMKKIDVPTLVVTGDVKPEEIFQMAQDLFGDWPRREKDPFVEFPLVEHPALPKSEGVVRTVSPIERRRTTNTRRTPDQSQRAGASDCGSSSMDSVAKARCRTLGEDSIISRRLFIFDLRFVDQHYGNVVANGIDAFALDALQTAAVRFQLNFGAARRANQNLEQLFANSHSSKPLDLGKSHFDAT